MNQVKYFLKDNPLTPDPTDYCAVVQHDKPVDDEELQAIVLHRSTGVAKSDMLRIMEELKIAIRYFLSQGRSLNTSLINAMYSIQGVFTDEEDRFDEARHTLILNIKPGLGLQDITKELTPVKIAPPAGSLVLTSFTDTETGTKNDKLTPGAPGKLNGQKLKFDAADPLQGVFFVNETTNKAFKVDKYVECLPSKLIFKVPTGMAKGSYKAEVRKAGKTARLTASLQV